MNSTSIVHSKLVSFFYFDLMISWKEIDDERVRKFMDCWDWEFKDIDKLPSGSIKMSLEFFLLENQAEFFFYQLVFDLLNRIDTREVKVDGWHD